MNIITNQAQPSFGAKFVNTKSFREVVSYAEQNRKLLELDTALNRLSHVKCEDILLIHGNANGGVYSNFNLGHRTVQNLGGKTPEEASFNGILELGELGRKFKRLIGGNSKIELSSENILKKYSRISI